MAKILITGGTGSIGKHLIEHLLSEGHQIIVLSRHVFNHPKVNVFKWEPNSGFIDERAFDGVEHIVNLAGAGIGERRWTEKRKAELLSSRVDSVKVLWSYLNKLKLRPASFIGASAVGYYGAQTTEKIFLESDPPAKDFLGSVCHEWEESYKPISAIGVPISVLRIAPVLAKDGGVYKALVKPTKLNLGAVFGSGKQYMPWIHVEDLVKIISELISGNIPNGTYNAVAPQQVNSSYFMKALADSLNKKMILPRIPSVVLKMALGEMSSMILEGSRISDQKLIEANFNFKYKTIEAALAQLAKD